MANQDSRALKEKGRKRSDLPSVTRPMDIGFNGSGKSTFDRKAEEMKAFLKRNPVPKEFLN